MKKTTALLVLVGSVYGQNFITNFFKYSTAYASFSLNAPRYQEDRFTIVGGLSTGVLEIDREERELKPDFQTAFGLRKIGRFKYEPKRGVKNAGVGGTWYDGSEKNTNEGANVGVVKGWEYLIKFIEGRQWGSEYINQEYWLRYTGDWAVAKIGYTELGLEDVEYIQSDLRFKYASDFGIFSNSFDEVTLSVGLKHRQHPVYGFDAMVLDTTWYRGSWWDFAETEFGWDDNMWFVEGAGYWEGDEVFENLQLYTSIFNEETQTWEVVALDISPFWNEHGEFWGYDWYWADENGNIVAYTDREYFLYHFPHLLEDYIEDLKKGLGYQRETSLVLGFDMYHYADNWWAHMWGNWLPYHYGHDKYSWHNARHYKKHLSEKKSPHMFMWMEPMWMAWNDYDIGAIFGVKLKDNVGVFAEGRYLFYWERPAYDFKFGVNYQFIGG